MSSTPPTRQLGGDSLLHAGARAPVTRVALLFLVLLFAHRVLGSGPRLLLPVAATRCWALPAGAAAASGLHEDDMAGSSDRPSLRGTAERQYQHASDWKLAATALCVGVGSRAGGSHEALRYAAART